MSVVRHADHGPAVICRPAGHGLCEPLEAGWDLPGLRRCACGQRASEHAPARQDGAEVPGPCTHIGPDGPCPCLSFAPLSYTPVEEPVDNPRPTHPCPGPGHAGDVQVPENLLACAGHWAQVPGPQQRAVYLTWRNRRGKGTPEHVAACQAAVACMRPLARPQRPRAGLPPPGPADDLDAAARERQDANEAADAYRQARPRRPRRPPSGTPVGRVDPPGGRR